VEQGTIQEIDSASIENEIKKGRDGYNVSTKTQTISWRGRECLSNKGMGKRVGSWRHWPRRLEALNNFHSGRLFFKHTDDLEVNVERNLEKQ
jgi:hypothetical protein